MKGNKKPKEYLFVDGYNIINSWENLKEISKVDLEQARMTLVEILAEYKHYSGIEIFVVFDAYMVKGNNRSEEEYKGIRIIYTKENELADHYIEKALDEMGREMRVRVATSDWVEQQIILSRGGIRISARELQAEIEDEMRMVNRKRKRLNTRNDISIGRLEDQVMHKLKDWKGK
ncbi:MAG: NYN domain-containing protein [Gudongella sp.]|nr:NYN domain-containing protein [Gudongella sp.]